MIISARPGREMEYLAHGRTQFNSRSTVVANHIGFTGVVLAVEVTANQVAIGAEHGDASSRISQVDSTGGIGADEVALDSIHTGITEPYPISGVIAICKRSADHVAGHDCAGSAVE